MLRKYATAPMFALALFGLAAAGPAFAWHVGGTIRCADTGLPVGNITVKATNTDGAPFTGTATTDEFGYYFITLPDQPGCFRVAMQLGAGDQAVTPASGSYDFCTTETIWFADGRDFVISGASCGNGACWLTAGGAKFESVDRLDSGSNGPNDTWGGNVYPGCSPTAGDGGQWNHVDHAKKLHFQGWSMRVLRCGNVDGIPAGSTSPVTPYNYIEFTGTGTLKGIHGRKVEYPVVYFWAHCEDRNEPGSKGQRDGAGKDRYFLNVYTDPSDPVGSSVLLKDVDGNPATMDPMTITDGNMQIHVSSCATPSAAAAPVAPSVEGGIAAPAEPLAAASASGKLWFAAPSPSPARHNSVIRFGLPAEASVSLVAFDITGRQVRQMAAGSLSPGEHSFDWNLHNDAGQPLDAGVYFVRLVVNGRAQSRPVVVVK